MPILLLFRKAKKLSLDTLVTNNTTAAMNDTNYTIDLDALKKNPFRFDASPWMATGVYFYRINFNDGVYVAMKKMMLLK